MPTLIRLHCAPSCHILMVGSITGSARNTPYLLPAMSKGSLRSITYLIGYRHASTVLLQSEQASITHRGHSRPPQGGAPGVGGHLPQHLPCSLRECGLSAR
ncbi:hypothetical protein BaRGS_00015886 [Batillaria attramentaria]|uniref:Uncharacterized protein n=1 Tax=Batillaria attramentaria TaxID=370345 RepID=A0ABD0L1H8_9CAEN